MWLVLSLSVPTYKVGASPSGAAGGRCRARPTLKASVHQDYHQLPSGLWESLDLGTLINASSLPSAGPGGAHGTTRGRAGTRVQAALSPLLPCSPPGLP